MAVQGILTVIKFVVIAIAILVLGLITSWIDRKVTARIQARVGPPWFQPIADILKLLGKETLVPEGAGRNVFLYAPVIGLAGMALAAALLGNALISPEVGFVGDVVVLVYLLVIPAIALIIGASASGNPMAAVGASREMKLILGYELPYLIVIATVIYKTGFTLKLGDIVETQALDGWNLWSISGVIGFFILLLSAQAKLGLVPFDIPEADQELMGGVITEYSGPPLALIRITKTMLLAVLPLLMVTLLMGGVQFEGLSILWGFLKYLVIVVLIVLIRNTNPRVRIDQALKFFWGPVTALSIIAFILAYWGL
ncbi:MAG: NADH-quinone oxidoreductase subunit H [Candidatus Latescibacteria bacterium]|nr:NADH-quinone oxidoreductase subunit H [Candidatus Latescibacterota bacterium]